MQQRQETFGRSLRLYKTELAQAETLYQRALTRRRGRIVFIAGQPKSGRTDLLNAIGQHLAQQKSKPALQAGQFHEDRYTPRTKDYFPVATAAGEAAALLAKLLTGAPQTAIDFAAQLFQTGLAYRLAQAPGDAPVDWAEAIKGWAREAALQQPAVLLIDDLDELRHPWLLWLLTDLAGEIDRDLPLLAFVTLTGPRVLPERREDEPSLWRAARELMQRGVAEWWPLQPLSRAEVAAYLGNARPGIAEHLHHVTGGYPRRVLELWRDWQEREVVHWSDADDCWTFDRTKRPTLNLVKDVIDDRLKNHFGPEDQESIQQARALLAYGALEGECFTAAAVAGALGWEEDDLIDFIDDELLQTEGNADGLLLEAEPAQLPVPTTRPLWRYRFAHDLFWLPCFEYGWTEAERGEASAKLAEALQTSYGDEARQVAGALARLYRNVGSHDAASHFQRMWEHNLARETMRQHGLAMARAVKTDWSDWQKWVALELLLEAGRLMMHSAHVTESQLVLVEALQLAVTTGEKGAQVNAGYMLGRVLLNSGQDEQAAARYQAALLMSQEIGRRDGEAVCLTELGKMAEICGEYEQAVTHYRAALIINQEIGRRDNESICLAGLAEVALARGEYEQAATQYQAALVINQEIGSQYGEIVCIAGLADVAVACDNHEQALTYYQAALMFNQKTGRRGDEAASFLGLANVAKARGEYEQAGELYRAALVIGQEIGRVDNEAACLLGLAAVTNARCEHEHAATYYRAALAIYQEIGRRDGEAKCLAGLADVAYAHGEREQAGALYQAALEIETALGMKQEQNVLQERMAQLVAEGSGQRAQPSVAAGDVINNID